MSRAGSFSASVAPLREPTQKRVEHIDRAVADREDLAGLLDLGRDAAFFEELDRLARAERGESRVQELAVGAERGNDAARVAVVGDVAARCRRT